MVLKLPDPTVRAQFAHTSLKANTPVASEKHTALTFPPPVDQHHQESGVNLLFTDMVSAAVTTAAERPHDCQNVSEVFSKTHTHTHTKTADGWPAVVCS